MARMTRTSGGSEEEMVVYTDREVNRTLLAHYGSSRFDALGMADANDGLQIRASGVGLMGGTSGTNLAAPSTSNPDWRATNHTFPPSVLPAGSHSVMKSVTSLSGSLHGVSGTFQCRPAPCDFDLTGEYYPDTDPVATKNRLNTVTFDTVGNELYFRPSPTALIHLYEGGDRGVDDQFVVFGWWKNTPEVTTGAYDFEVFAGTNDTTIMFSGTTTGSYDGPAVGAYVEQIFLAGESGGHRHGEFTATAHLTSDGGVTGYVDGFRATQEGSGAAVAKSWRVNLIASNNVEIRLSGLRRMATGGWDHQFLANHTDSGLMRPVSGVGHFAASVESLEVVGAFGVRRVSPHP